MKGRINNGMQYETKAVRSDERILGSDDSLKFERKESDSLTGAADTVCVGKKNAWSRLLGVLKILFVVICVGIAADAVMSKGGDSLLGFRSFIVLSGSMNPVFDSGSYILVKEKQPRDIKVGDILTFRVDADTVLTHRVVEIIMEDGKYYFRTQGDANNIPDINAVAQEQVIGKAVFWINGLGQLLLNLRHPKNLFALLALLCGIFLIGTVCKRSQKKQFDGGDRVE